MVGDGERHPGLSDLGQQRVQPFVSAHHPIPGARLASVAGSLRFCGCIPSATASKRSAVHQLWPLLSTTSVGRTNVGQHPTETVLS